MVVMLLMSPRFVNHLELAGHADRRRAPTTWPSTRTRSRRGSRTRSGRRCPDDALLAAAADGSLATDAGFTTQLDRVFADPRTRDTIWQFWNEWMRFESFTGFCCRPPGVQGAGRRREPRRRRPRPLGRHGARDPRPDRPLHLDAAAGRSRDLMTSDVSVTKSADLAHLYGVPAWSGSGDYPRFTDGSRRGAPAARGAARVEPGADEPVPPGRVHPAIDPVRQPAAPRPEQPAAGLARSAAAEHGHDHPPALRRQGGRQRPLPEPATTSFSNLGYVMEAYDSLGRFRTDGEGVRRADRRAARDAADRHRRRAAGDPRRHAPGQRPGRAEPADPRERQGGGLPVGELLPLRACAAIRRATAPTPARTRRCAAASRRAARWPPRSAASRRSAGFRQHKVGAP